MEKEINFFNMSKDLLLALGKHIIEVIEADGVYECYGCCEFPFEGGEVCVENSVYIKGYAICMYLSSIGKTPTDWCNENGCILLTSDRVSKLSVAKEEVNSCMRKLLRKRKRSIDDYSCIPCRIKPMVDYDNLFCDCGKCIYLSKEELASVGKCILESIETDDCFNYEDETEIEKLSSVVEGKEISFENWWEVNLAISVYLQSIGSSISDWKKEKYTDILIGYDDEKIAITTDLVRENIADDMEERISDADDMVSWVKTTIWGHTIEN